jgi:hypothetical protein
MALRLSSRKSQPADQIAAETMAATGVADDRATMRNRRAIRLTAIVFVALAAGQYVQSARSGVGANAAVLRDPAVPASAMPQKTGMNRTLPVVLASARIAQVSAGAHSTAASPVIAVVATATDVPQAAPAAAAAPACTATLDLTAEPGAMLALRLLAPCHPEERVVLRHAGLAITGRTDAAGSLSLSLPALASDGAVSASFADGTAARAAQPVPDLAALRRIGVVWQGGDRFALRGTAAGGDVTADRPGPQPDAATAPAGGWLTALGDASVPAPLLAQVYTFPSDPAVIADVAIEAPVGPDTCGREMLGQTVASAEGVASVTDLSLAMPDCDGRTGFLVLNNLFPDMKIAASN